MKNKIDIARIIDQKFAERKMSSKEEKLYSEVSKTYNALNESLNRKQNKLLIALDEAEGCYYVERDQALIQFVLDFISSCHQ